MMVTKKKIIVKKKPVAKKKQHVVRMHNDRGNTIEIDGVMYRGGKSQYYMKDGIKHVKYTDFEPFSIDKHAEALKAVALKLKDVIPPERYIEELLKNTKTEQLEKFLKKLDSGDVEIKHHDGCLGFTIVNKKNKKKSQYVSIFK